MSQQVFRLDDDMVDLLQPGQVFDVDLAENKGYPDRFDISLTEIEK